MLLLFEVNDSVRNVEIFTEAPFVAGTQYGRNSSCQVVMDVGGGEVGKWFKKFRGLPCVQSAREVLARAE